MPLEIIRADITTLKVDAIVCPTNTHLIPGSGIDRVVYSKAGSEFVSECMEKAYCPEGGAVIVRGYSLPSSYVIMTVGPHWNGGDNGELEVLEKAYRSSLDSVRKLALTSVAVPLISAGYYGVPDYLSLRTATDVIREFLASYDADVYIVVYNRLAFDLSKGIFRTVAEYIKEDEVSAWEAKWGRNKCIPRIGKSDILDEENEIHDLKNTLRFQMIGNSECDRILFPEKKGIIGGERTGLDIEIEDKEKRKEKRKKLSVDPEELKTLEKKCDGFSDYLRNKVLEEGMTSVEVYKKANISHKLYSKIMCDSQYKPGRDTAIALALALELDKDDFSDMLSRAGFALSPSDRKDCVISYFVENRYYDILVINETLFALDLVPIGYKK